MSTLPFEHSLSGIQGSTAFYLHEISNGCGRKARSRTTTESGNREWAIEKEKEDVLGARETAGWLSGYTLGHSSMRTRTTV